MAKKDVLEELSYSLSEKERTNLLERINRSIDDSEEDDEEKDAVRKKKDHDLFIQNELKNTVLVQQITYAYTFEIRQ